MKKIFILTLFSSLIFISGQAHSVPITISNGNSAIEIDGESQNGVSKWIVNGVNHLKQQWHWFRINDATRDSSLDSLQLLSQTVLTNSINLQYGGANSPIVVSLTYTLEGDPIGSNKSRIRQELEFGNRTLDPINVVWFDYTNLDLTGTSADSFVEHDIFLHAFWQADSLTSISDIVMSTAPESPEISFGIYWSPDLLHNLNDDRPSNLNMIPRLIFNDLEYAFQYTALNLAPTDSRVIVRNISISTIPEPAALALMCIGLMAFGAFRQKHDG